MSNATPTTPTTIRLGKPQLPALRQQLLLQEQKQQTTASSSSSSIASIPFYDLSPPPAADATTAARLLSSSACNSSNNNTDPTTGRWNRIVHIGVGGFHRSHLALYTHQLLNQQALMMRKSEKQDSENSAQQRWCIVGGGIRPEDQHMTDDLRSQDHLYSVLERNGMTGVDALHIVGSIACTTGGDAESLIEAVAHPLTRIVSLTVTEAGYRIRGAEKALDFDDPMVQHDVKNISFYSSGGAATTGTPKTVLGVLAAGLHRRRVRFGADGGITVLTCDNIQHNGEVVRRALLALVGAQEKALSENRSALSDWISRYCTFPSSMVDRITPVTTPSDVAYLSSHYGIQDVRPVICEFFRQWIIEDKFVNGLRPRWETLVGDKSVQFVDNVVPYEVMKLRLLNASHLAVACLGDLMGLTYIDETMNGLPGGQGGGGDAATSTTATTTISAPDSRPFVLRRYMEALMKRETGPTVPAVPGIDIDAYQQTLILRFANPSIKDTVQRVATDAPLNTVLDSIRDRRRSKAPFTLLALALAAWLRRVRGGTVGETNRPIIVKHPFAEELKRLGDANPDDPKPQMMVAAVFGDDLVKDPVVMSAVQHWLAHLHLKGIVSTVEAALLLSESDTEGGVVSKL